MTAGEVAATADIHLDRLNAIGVKHIIACLLK
jgi:hypothetical protein